MTDQKFRVLIWIYIALLAGAFLSTTYFGIDSDVYDDSWLGTISYLPTGWLYLSIAFLGLIVLSCLAGLYLFKPWGRKFSLATTLLGLPINVLLGTSVYTPIEAMFYDASSMLWGAILAVAYFSPVKTRFER